MTRPDPALLADLDAGLLDPAIAREVRAAALADPRTTAVLDALRATRADLAAFPTPAAPPAAVRRWLDALAAEQGPAGSAAAPRLRATPDPPAGPASDGPAPNPSAPDPSAPDPTAPSPTRGPLGPGQHLTADAPAHEPAAPAIRAPGGHAPAGRTARTPRDAHQVPARHLARRRRTPADRPHPNGPGGRAERPDRPPRGSGAPRRPSRRAVTSLLAAVALVVGVVVAVLAGQGSAVDVTRVELAAVARSTIGVSELGPYTDEPRRTACLSAAGHPGAEVLGGRSVRYDGSPGVLLVLSTGVLGRFRVLVVDDACRTLADDVFGR